MTTDKLQVHTVTHKVEQMRHAKTLFGATTLKIENVSVRLNWEIFVSAAKFTQQRFVV